MFNPNKTIQLITGGLFNAKQTWQNYLKENHEWQDTLMLLTGPMIIISVILSSILTWVFSSYYLTTPQGGIWHTILQLIGAIVGIVIAAFIFSFLAGFFKGKHNFNKGLAALSLSAIPAYIGSLFGTLPFIGWLIALVLGILSLVFLYKIIPSYLEVPDNKRVIHFITSLIASIVIAFILTMALGLNNYKEDQINIGSNKHNAESSPENSTGNISQGIFGVIGHQANLMEQADNTHYAPPEDGQITENQINTYLSVLKKAAEYRESQQEKIKSFDETIQDKEEFSFSDISKLTSGMGSVMSAANAEMEVVTTGGGNWAEHQWVKDQLHVASIQKNLNTATKHNYALYQKYLSQLNH